MNLEKATEVLEECIRVIDRDKDGKRIATLTYFLSLEERMKELKEELPGMLVEAKVELIKNSAMYDVDVEKLNNQILNYLLGKDKSNK